jgi:hypothetical protein
MPQWGTLNDENLARATRFRMGPDVVHLGATAGPRSVRIWCREPEE